MDRSGSTYTPIVFRQWNSSTQPGDCPSLKLLQAPVERCVLGAAIGGLEIKAARINASNIWSLLEEHIISNTTKMTAAIYESWARSVCFEQNMLPIHFICNKETSDVNRNETSFQVEEHMKLKGFWILGSTMILSACAAPPPLPTSSLPDGIHFAQVLIRVKQEVGYYESSQPTTDADWKKEFEKAGLYDKNGNPPADGVCGTGKIALNIKKVQMDFLANYDTTHGVSGGLKIPVLPAAFAASVAPSAGLSSESVGSVEIKYTYYVPSGIPDSSDWDYLKQNPDSANFKAALDGLRAGLIAATGHKPCFLDAPKIGADPETVTFAVQLKQSANAGVGFDILLLNLSDTNTTLLAHTNTITVTYQPAPTGDETIH